MEAVLRQGFIEALTLAKKKNLPIEAYWICAGEDSVFEISCAWSHLQVTMNIVTPTVPDAAHDIWRTLDLNDDDPILIIRRGPLDTDAYGQETMRKTDDILTLKMKTRVAAD